jgi:tyrosyl-tRNA synthetase
LDLLVEQKLAKSRNEARRLVEQGGVRLNGEPIADINHALSLTGEDVLQVGKRRFLKLRKA